MDVASLGVVERAHEATFLRRRHPPHPHRPLVCRTGAVESGRLPVFTRYVSQEYDFSLDELFEFGLARMLDGLAAFRPGAC